MSEWPPVDFDEVQDVVREHATGPYYTETYAQHEQHYLPDLFEWLSSTPRGRVLEIGPGWGTTMVWLAANGWRDITVMDIMPHGHWITQDLLDLCCAEYVRADISEKPMRCEPFDLIIMTQVIGHLKFQPMEALSHVKEMLRGEFVASVLDEEDYPGLASAFGNDWRAVPNYGKAPSKPDEVITQYNMHSFGELVRSVFEDAFVWKPDGSWSVLFASAGRIDGAMGGEA